MKNSLNFRSCKIQKVLVLITSTLWVDHSIIIDNGEVEEGDHKDLKLQFTQQS